MELWAGLTDVADRRNVLRHSFYVRWTQGELTRAELALYAGQYAHAVDALAAASRHAATAAAPEIATELADHAAEEQAHVALWSQFARAVGAGRESAPLPETAQCADAWRDPQRALLPTLVALYAIESAQPAISETKRVGLIEHYGVAEGPATAYFDVHVVRDREHAASAKELIVRELDAADTGALVDEAERVLAANWLLLDGVERACRGAAPAAG